MMSIKMRNDITENNAKRLMRAGYSRIGVDPLV